jgi:hypothetical protein
VDAIGNFGFAGLESGEYELILAGPETEIHLQTLRVFRNPKGF